MQAAGATRRFEPNENPVDSKPAGHSRAAGKAIFTISLKQKTEPSLFRKSKAVGKSWKALD
jgi:hypothetical protein